MITEPVDDTTAAAWLASALTDFQGRVVDVATDTFPCYARIFHRPDQGLPSDVRPSTWESIARDRGTVFHPAAQFTDLAREASRPEHERIPGPLAGSLDRLTLPLLRDCLAPHTSTPDACWYALWSGSGQAAGRWTLDHTFSLWSGPYWLFGGSLADVVELSAEIDSGGSPAPLRRTWRRAGQVHTPSIWWPEDRAWLVHSLFGHDSTIVGGTLALIRAIVDHPGIEALQVDPSTSLYANGDTINGTHPSGWPQEG